MSITTTPPEARATDLAIASVEEQLGILFTRAKANLRARAILVHRDLQPAGYTILATIARSGPTHASALADLLAIDKSIVSRQANTLEDLGLLERECDPDDRRATFMKATTAGLEQVTAVRLAEQALLYERLRGWPVGDLDKLSELLGRLNQIDQS